MKPWIRPLKALGACEEALIWCEGYDSLDKAWAKCERGDWMLWLAGRLSGKAESKSRRTLVLAACGCARLSLPHVPAGEKRSLKAIEVAEAWAKQEPGVTLDDVKTAKVSAAAAYAAAAYAAYAAAYAANANAVYAAELGKSADIVRKHYPVPPTLTEHRQEVRS